MCSFAGCMNGDYRRILYLPILLTLPLMLLFGAATTVSAQTISTGDGAWVWQNPLPQGNALLAAWGADADNIWFVGDGGTILEWNGSTWRSHHSGVKDRLTGIWGADANNIWAVGWDCQASEPCRGPILKWNGSTWNVQFVGPAPLEAVWGADADNVWAVGVSGTILHWDGSSWTVQSSGIDYDLNDIWGTDGDNIWVVGTMLVWDSPTITAIFRWDGQTWEHQYSSSGWALQAIWGASVDNIWATGHGFGESSPILLLRWNGHDWIQEPGLPTGASWTWLNDIWGTDANNVWVVGSEILHWDGNAWSLHSIDLPGALGAVWGTDADLVWAAGGAGTILQLNGTEWNPIGGSPTTSLRGVLAVWGADASNVWAVGAAGNGSGGILKWNGACWSTQEITGAVLSDVWGTDVNNVWAVGSAGTILQWDGSRWIPHPSNPQYNLLGVWGADVNNVWVVGYQGCYSGDGGICNSIIQKWNGNSWNVVSNVAHRLLTDIWGVNPDNVWTVGLEGEILKWDGTSWLPQDSGTTAWLYGIGGTGVDDVWVVGSTILHWDGSQWRNQSSGAPGINSSEGYSAIWAADGENVWAVGPSGMIRWGGSDWTVHDIGADWLRAVWGIDANDIWAAGVNGAILRRHTHPLSVNSVGSGSGIIRRSHPGYPCGSYCSEYGQGIDVTLLADAHLGSSFLGWSGDCSGDGPCQLTIDAAKVVTATFSGHSELVRLPQVQR